MSLDGDDAVRMLELLNRRSEEIEYKILKHGIFTELSVSFRVEISRRQQDQ